MLSSEVLTVGYGLGSALAWGAGDFSGGFASKKGSALTVIFYSQMIGVLLLGAVHAIFPGGDLSVRHILWGGLGGICGVLGLIALYNGLARGRMGIVAPLSAVVTALVPVAAALFTEGWPKQTQMLGFALALSAVWFFSASGGLKADVREDIVSAVLAGTGFGLFFICIDRVSTEAIIWPLIAARLASIALIGFLLLGRRQMTPPPWAQLPGIALAGILDITGNAFFALAARHGRLDVSAILSSMYPAATVILARCILKERLAPQQWAGFLSVCGALVLISL